MFSPIEMSAQIQAAADFRVKYSRRFHNDVQGRELSQLDMLDDGQQHDVKSHEADENTQKKLPTVKRSCLTAFKVNLGVLYLLTMAGITARYVLVTLEKEQLQNRTNKLINIYSHLEEKVFDDNSQLQSSYDALTKNYSQLKANLKVMEANNNHLQEEVKQLKDKIETLTQKKLQFNTRKSPEEWIRFASNSYFKSTERKTWSDSRRDCQDKGADLVMINSKEEQQFVSELNMGGESWIGLQAIKKRISRFVFKWEWRWMNGSPLQETFWAPGQEDASPDYNAACCDINGKWIKRYGSKTFICEK
ncbi:CD209 antigen-like protein 2 isoform X1 [Oreochromis aureus]|nr:CD209 antigen-like protein 2 isoform X1 [Oreochromis aureus]